MFSRFAGFVVCWMWDGWHYRFGWLVGAIAAMTSAFVVILTAPWLWILVAAQVVFGLSIGIIYYSSLYYSMHVGDNHGEQGGVHEAAIGAGNCVGPWIGAGALFLLPGQPNAAVWAVAALLIGGLGWMLKTWSARS
jgi:predicted MFS family arabinose efflux permease